VQGRPVVLTQRWAEIVWAHWRVPAATVQALLPAALEVDTFDGYAWVGLVPFEMQDLRVVAAGHRLPPVGSTRSFTEVNVRTYVIGPAGPGVWFHSLDATSRLAVAVARGLWSLPYFGARVDREIDAGHRSWHVQRRRGAAGGLGVALGPRVQTTRLDAFLTARFRLYAPLSRTHLLTAPVRHRPWPLRRAELERLDPGLVVDAGYRPNGRPDHLVAGDAVDVAVGAPSLIRS
jgi:uncharacterized protein YqjF (DUF2071 family)